MELWKSKPCGPCYCPEWDHGGVSGCYGSPERPCDGCAGYIPDESADDIVCPEDRQKFLLDAQEKMRLWILENNPNIVEELKEAVKKLEKHYSGEKNYYDDGTL